MMMMMMILLKISPLHTRTHVHTVVTALLKVANYVVMPTCDRSSTFLAVLLSLDISAAFDTIGHSIRSGSHLA